MNSKNYEKIEELFEVAEKITSTDIEDYKDKKLELIEFKDETELSVEEINLKEMYSQFRETYEIFRESVSLSKDMLKKIHEKIILFDETMTPDMVSAYATLQKNITDALKTVTSSYKLLSEARNILVQKEESVKSVTNNVNIYTGSTQDLLKSFDIIDSDTSDIQDVDILP